jgi:hypothetical protein
VPRKVVVPPHPREDEVFARVCALFQELHPYVEAGTDPVLVDTEAMLAKHGLVHLGDMRFALEDDLDAQLQINEPEDPSIKQIQPGRARFII